MTTPPLDLPPWLDSFAPVQTPRGTHFEHRASLPHSPRLGPCIDEEDTMCTPPTSQDIYTPPLTFSTPGPPDSPVSRGNERLPEALPSPQDTPARRRLAARVATRERSHLTPSHFFLGRACCPPFVFDLSPAFADSNIQWAEEGKFNENEYLVEVGESVDESAGMMGNLRQGEMIAKGRKRRKSKNNRNNDEMRQGESLAKYQLDDPGDPDPFRVDATQEDLSAPMKKPFQSPCFSSTKGWTAEQERALWEAQLEYGERRNWPSVVSRVNACQGAIKTQNECSRKWTRMRDKVFPK